MEGKKGRKGMKEGGREVGDEQERGGEKMGNKESKGDKTFIWYVMVATLSRKSRQSSKSHTGL